MFFFKNEFGKCQTAGATGLWDSKYWDQPKNTSWTGVLQANILKQQRMEVFEAEAWRIIPKTNSSAKGSFERRSSWQNSIQKDQRLDLCVQNFLWGELKRALVVFRKPRCECRCGFFSHIVRASAWLEMHDWKCILCDEEYKSPVATKCRHIFCEQCALRRDRL